MNVNECNFYIMEEINGARRFDMGQLNVSAHEAAVKP